LWNTCWTAVWKQVFTIPRNWWCLPMICLCYHNLLWIHPIQWSFWLQMLQLNMHQRSVLFENLTSLLFSALSYKLLPNTICAALTLALQSVNTQMNNKGYSQLTKAQRNQHKQFCSYIV
jgi:hypothetical protein